MKKVVKKKVPKRAAGGLATVKKYGSKHMSKLAKKMQKLKREQKDADTNNTKK